MDGHLTGGALFLEAQTYNFQLIVHTTINTICFFVLVKTSPRWSLPTKVQTVFETWFATSEASAIVVHKARAAARGSITGVLRLHLGA